MSALLWVDGLYADFCATMSGSLRDEARNLAFTLGLSPARYAPWSRVFCHEVTLAAPWMLAEAMPSAPPAAAQEALFAHVLAVIGAMGVDRIADGQVAPTPSLRRVLAAARAERDRHLQRAAGAGASVALGLAAQADLSIEAALEEERALLRGPHPVDFDLYESVSERKQAPGMVATTVLAARAGWSRDRVEAARLALLDVALALQLHDDVVDWEQDAAQGRAWALALAGGARSRADAAGGPSAAPRGLPDAAGVPENAPRGLPDAAGVPENAPRGVPAAARAEVHASGVLSRMLERARRRFRSASSRAGALGASRLARWAAERERALEHIADREARHAGYVHRAYALAPWARAVLGSKP